MFVRSRVLIRLVFVMFPMLVCLCVFYGALMCLIIACLRCCLLVCLFVYCWLFVYFLVFGCLLV